MHQPPAARKMIPSLLILLGLIVQSATASSLTKGNGGSVRCTRDEMAIRVPVLTARAVKLDKWAVMSGCQFTIQDQYHVLHLPLTDDLPCGVTRVKNTITGSSLFYQKLRISGVDGTEEFLLVKCSASDALNATEHNIVRRELPPEFVEPDYIEITSEVVGSAPVPILSVGVRQDGSLVDGAINVSPGTPLTMEVFLDNESAGTYGILVSYLEVTDNDRKKETIVYNGCTIDANLFENFDTKKGDFLSAKFRAFKFPESNYVLFRGTVDVCLDKCQGITCFDGKVGYGRKRRGIDGAGADPNKLFEVTMTTFIKFSDDSTGTGRSGVSEIFAEEILRERFSNFGTSSRTYEAPLIRRSSNSPPSIMFDDTRSSAPTILSFLSFLTFLLPLVLLRPHLW